MFGNLLKLYLLPLGLLCLEPLQASPLNPTSDVVLTWPTQSQKIISPCPILIEVLSREQPGDSILPVSGANVVIIDNGLKSWKEANPIRRGKGKYYKVHPTDFFGYTIAYLYTHENLSGALPPEHTIEIRGSLVVKADGYLPYSEELRYLLGTLNDPRLIFKDNTIPCCRIFLTPLERKKTRGHRKGKPK